MLDELLGSKSRARIVARLLVSASHSAHLRELARACGGSVSSAQREIERLESIGLVTSVLDERGRRRVSLVEGHPFVNPLAGMVAADAPLQYEARIANVPNLDPGVAQALGGWIDAIVTSFDPIRIVLFGSQAAGTADEDSDVDLLVVMPHVDDPGRLMVEMRAILGSVGRGVDVITTDPAGIERAKNMMSSVVREAVEEGVTVYDLTA